MMMMLFYHTSSKLFLLFFICTTFTFTCLSNSTPTQYSILGPILDKLPSEDEALLLFLQWKKEHGRAYNDLEEMANKFKIFVSNVKYIVESNAKRTSPSDYVLALNKFADWSPKEFQETYLKLNYHNGRGQFDEHIAMEHGDLSAAPSSLDWRLKGVVTDVKDQEACGSCWAFSATGAIEGINAIVTGKLISLSEQELVDCDPVSYGCYGGWMIAAYDYVISNGGIALETDYTYNASKGTCNASQVPKSVSIDGYENVTQSDDGLLLATQQQPISVALDATDFQFYSSGIFDGPHCPPDVIYANHAVLIVGYDSLGDGEDYWIVKNSWDTSWGMDGYIWIKRNTIGLPNGVCSINIWASYPTKKYSPSSSNPTSSINFM